jgi:hypothetical protein
MTIAAKCECGKSPYYCVGGEGCKWIGGYIIPLIDPTEETSIAFAEWVSLHCFNKFVDNQWLWGYKEKWKRVEVGWLSTKQLFEEFKNRNK